MTFAAKKRVLVPYREPSEVGPYLEAVRAADLEPVPALPGEMPDLDGCVGLLLTGGTDVNPARYGEELQPETEEPDDQRDAYELRLIEESLNRDLPILAICRGHQLLNVYFGGTLIQHLGGAKHEQRPEDVSRAAHTAIVEPGTALAAVTGCDTLQVNSRHHQAVKRVGNGLRVSARDPEDGVIEGLEMPDRTFVIGVQWHPENQVRAFPEQLKLFRGFAEKAGRYQEPR